MSGRPFAELMCIDDAQRRADIRTADNIQGIDYLEVVTAPPADNQLVLEVHFVPKATAAGTTNLHALLDDLQNNHPERVTVSGGIRVTAIEVTLVARAGDLLRVRVDRYGDFSDYTLAINDPRMDPARSEVSFSFKAGCPSRFDCAPMDECPPPPRTEPLIDYMARDYASFRQALLDFVPTIAPNWVERHEADLAMTTLELFAYVGDQLSYNQEAVANEAYLENARQRQSVRRHAALVDYRMHDGASARALIELRPAGPGALHVPAGTQLLTRIQTPIRSHPVPHPPVIVATPDDAKRFRAAADAIFETILPADLHPALTDIAIHTWESSDCCLPRGSTVADLVGDIGTPTTPPAGQEWKLHPGRYLLFEEVKGPDTGLEATARPTERQLVRLTKVESVSDPFFAGALTRVTWDGVDALRFPFCVSLKQSTGTVVTGMSVAQANLTLADHGATLTEYFPGNPAPVGPEPPPRGITPGDRAFTFRLAEPGITCRTALPADTPSPAPAAALMTVDPRAATPQVSLCIGSPADLAAAVCDADHTWVAVGGTLLEASPFTREVVVEPDDTGRGWVRFGDGTYGMSPPPLSYIRATYRTGVGRTGNVGRDAIAHVLTEAAGPPLVKVRNPLPAWGGVDPEAVATVKKLAPVAFRAEQFRAVTEADYVAAAEKHPAVAHAVAMFRWTGSWLTVFLAVDPRGRVGLPDTLKQEIHDFVASYALAGYDLEIRPPIYAPLDIEIQVCAARGYFAADVERAVLEALASRPLHGRPAGFFQPDDFAFGQPLYLASLYRAVLAVEGVDSAVVTRFCRVFDPDVDPGRPFTAANVDQGFVGIDSLEVARLDNDPNFPENGVLRIEMLGTGL